MGQESKKLSTGQNYTIDGGLDITGTFKIDGVEVTASAAELNAADAGTAGVVTASKAVVVDANKDVGDFRNLDAVNFDAGASGTAGSVDIFPTTALKGKIALTAAANTSNDTITIVNAEYGQATTLTIPDVNAATGAFLLSTGTVTVSSVDSAELDNLAGVVAGTSTASKAAVLGANKDLDELRVETTFKLGATAVTATAAEINKLDGAPYTVTTVSTTPASGSCAVQLAFKDAAGVAVAVPVSGQGYLSESADGTTHDAADTSIAVLTNGALTTGGATASIGPWFNYTTTAAGLLGATITAAADSYYLVFVLPNGTLAISDEIVVNA